MPKTIVFNGERKDMAERLAAHLGLRYETGNAKFKESAELLTKLYNLALTEAIERWLQLNTVEYQ